MVTWPTAAIIVTILTGIFTLVLKYVPSRENDYVPRSECNLRHNSLDREIKEIKDSVKSIDAFLRGGGK